MAKTITPETASELKELDDALNPHGPAFPARTANLEDMMEGLSKRELLAGMAMQGLLSGDSKGTMEYEDCAKHAVAFADALFAELAKQGDSDD